MDIYAVIAIFALVATVAIALIGGYYFFELPGRLARKRNHPQAAAIRLCGWMGLFTALLFWAAAMVWSQLPLNHRATTAEKS